MTEGQETLKAVNIPASLHARVKKRLTHTDFKTVDEYIVYLVREVLNNIEKEEVEVKKDFTPEEEKEIEARLRNLGYID